MTASQERGEEDAAFDSVKEELLQIAQDNENHLSLNTIRTSNLNKSQYRDIRVALLGQASVFGDVETMTGQDKYSYSLKVHDGKASCYMIERKSFVSIF